jgi:hypothetical protein
MEKKETWELGCRHGLPHKKWENRKRLMILCLGMLDSELLEVGMC